MKLRSEGSENTRATAPTTFANAASFVGTSAGIRSLATTEAQLENVMSGVAFVTDLTEQELEAGVFFIISVAEA